MKKLKPETSCVSARPLEVSVRHQSPSFAKKKKKINQSVNRSITRPEEEDVRLTYPAVQFLLELLVLLEEQRVRLLPGAESRRELVALALHPVQLDAQRLAQLFVRRRVRLKKGAAVSLRPLGPIRQPDICCSRTHTRRRRMASIFESRRFLDTRNVVLSPFAAACISKLWARFKATPGGSRRNLRTRQSVRVNDG